MSVRRINTAEHLDNGIHGPPTAGQFWTEKARRAEFRRISSMVQELLRRGEAQDPRCQGKGVKGHHYLQVIEFLTREIETGMRR